MALKDVKPPLGEDLCALLVYALQTFPSPIPMTLPLLNRASGGAN